MKFNLILFAVLVLLGGCGNAENKPDLSHTTPEEDPLESAVEWSRLQERNGDAYIPNTDKPYSGWAKRTFENGQVEILAEFTDGTVTRLQQWQENGIPEWDIGYTQGKIGSKDVPIDNHWDSNESHHNGNTIQWHENGQKKEEGNFKDGKPDGLHTKWYDNGQKEKEANFKDDKNDGLFTFWYKNGQNIEEVNWKDGKEDGLTTFWHENGQKHLEINYKDGKQDGLFAEWYENGQKKGEGNFKDGKQDGLSTGWYESGQKFLSLTVDNGKFLDAQVWLKNGENCKETNLKNGNGKVCFYDENSTLVSINNFISGDINTAVSFHSNGGNSLISNFQNGELHGTETSFYENGKVREKGSYKNGNKEGLWTDWRKDGTKDDEINYNNGKYHGLWTSWHKNGNKKSESNYKFGKKEGLSTEWNKDGTKFFESNWKDNEIIGKTKFF